MWHTALVAFATFFVTVAPLKAVPVFAVLTKAGDTAYRRRMAVKGTVIGGGILLLLAEMFQRLVGETALNVFSRVLGILLMALAAELSLKGLRGSALFK